MSEDKSLNANPGAAAPWGHPAAFAVLAVLAFAVYSNTLSYPFQFDDHLYVIQYNKGRSLSEFWPPYGTRYISYLSFALNYHFSGLNTTAYHVTNTLVHLLNGFGVYLLMRLTLRTPLMRESAGTSDSPSFIIALFASVIFTAHPVQTEAVTYISQRFASLATLFYIYSLLAFVKWRLVAGEKPLAGAPLFYISSIVLAAVAQKTKEIAFTLPFMVLFYDFVFFKGINTGRRLLQHVPLLLTLLIIPLTVLGHDIAGGEGAEIVGEGIRKAQIKDLETISRHDYLVTQFRVVVTYLRLLVLPIGQNLDYDYRMLRSIFDPQALTSLFFLLFVFSAAVFLIVRYYRKQGYLTLAGFGGIWFFVTISIESSIIPIKDLIFEHRLYLPSPGFAIAVSSALFLALGRVGKRSGLRSSVIAIALLAVTAASLGGAAYARNAVWKDEITLYEDSARKSPDKVRPRYNLAWAYHTRGEVDKAMEAYKEVIKIAPDNEKSHYNLALIYLQKAMYIDAVTHFKETIRIKPGSAVAYFNMAQAYNDMGNKNGAIESYSEAVRIHPAFEDAHYNLAWMYQEAGDLRSAEARYLAVVALNPGSADALLNLGTIYKKTGDMKKAAQAFRAVLDISPDNAMARAELDKISRR